MVANTTASDRPVRDVSGLILYLSSPSLQLPDELTESVVNPPRYTNPSPPFSPGGFV